MLLIQRDHLRGLYGTLPILRTAEWRTFTLRYREHDNMPPPLQRNERGYGASGSCDPLQQALTYLEQNVDLPAAMWEPGLQNYALFLLRNERSQKYCSEPCALPAQKAAKLRWWNKHGEAHRKEPEVRGGAKTSPRLQAAGMGQSQTSMLPGSADQNTAPRRPGLRGPWRTRQSPSASSPGSSRMPPRGNVPGV